MSTRSINTAGHFTVTDAIGRESIVYRELALIEREEGGWFIALTEPDPTQPEGDVLAGETIPVPDAAGVFDDLFRGMLTLPDWGPQRARIA